MGLKQKVEKIEEKLDSLANINGAAIKALDADNALFEHLTKRLLRVEKRLDKLEERGMDDGK